MSLNNVLKNIEISLIVISSTEDKLNLGVAFDLSFREKIFHLVGIFLADWNVFIPIFIATTSVDASNDFCFLLDSQLCHCVSIFVTACFQLRLSYTSTTCNANIKGIILFGYLKSTIQCRTTLKTSLYSVLKDRILSLLSLSEKRNYVSKK